MPNGVGGAGLAEKRFPVLVIGHWKRYRTVSTTEVRNSWTISGARKCRFLSRNPSAWYTTLPAKCWMAKHRAFDFGRMYSLLLIFPWNLSKKYMFTNFKYFEIKYSLRSIFNIINFSLEIHMLNSRFIKI